MTAGELADQFAVSKPTMSAHFAVLREADLIVADKEGRTITYRLKRSVLEEALLGYAATFGIETSPVQQFRRRSKAGRKVREGEA